MELKSIKWWYWTSTVVKRPFPSIEFLIQELQQVFLEEGEDEKKKSSQLIKINLIVFWWKLPKNWKVIKWSFYGKYQVGSSGENWIPISIHLISLHSYSFWFCQGCIWRKRKMCLEQKSFEHRSFFGLVFDSGNPANSSWHFQISSERFFFKKVLHLSFGHSNIRFVQPN